MKNGTLDRCFAPAAPVAEALLRRAPLHVVTTWPSRYTDIHDDNAVADGNRENFEIIRSYVRAIASLDRCVQVDLTEYDGRCWPQSLRDLHLHQPRRSI